MISLKNTIKKLPYPFKLPLLYMAALIPQKLRESKEYKEYVRFLESSSSWDATKIAEFQNTQLQLLIKHAYENVPFYTQMFNQYGISVKDIRDVGDLKKIPIIDKSVVKENREKFIAKNIDISKIKSINTGGTTSSPMHFYNTDTTNNREAAFFNRIWKKYGYEGQLCLVLRGDANDSEQLYKYSPYNKVISINTRNLDEEKMEGILGVISKYEPSFIQAYPSLIYLLSKYINRNELSGKIGKFKAVFCSSEKMYDFQREEIKKAFNTQVIDYYGHNERLALMEYCPICSRYHVLPEYGIVEFLDNNGYSVNQENEMAEIVGTGFNNYAFPLIRYKTSDIATISGSDCKCKCGKPYVSVKEIDGRSGDFLVTEDGKHYSPTMLEFAIRHVENFRDLQLVQKDYNQLEVLIVPNQYYTEAEGIRFSNELQKRIDTNINIEVRIVNHIDRPLNQKHRFIISNIK